MGELICKNQTEIKSYNLNHCPVQNRNRFLHPNHCHILSLLKKRGRKRIKALQMKQLLKLYIHHLPAQGKWDSFISSGEYFIASTRMMPSTNNRAEILKINSYSNSLA